MELHQCNDNKESTWTKWFDRKAIRYVNFKRRTYIFNHKLFSNCKKSLL